MPAPAPPSPTIADTATASAGRAAADSSPRGRSPAFPAPPPTPLGLPWRHALLALAVVAVWGSNFVVIRAALDVFPPLWLATLRFALALAPLALLPLLGGSAWRRWLARPRVATGNLLAYGVLIGAGQFGLLFLAIEGHIAPGLASLVVQVQVFFTVGLAMLVEGERPRPVQGIALSLALGGLGWIGANVGGEVTLRGLALVLAAAACWASGNIVARRAGAVSMLAYVVWSSFAAVPVLAALAWWREGPQALRDALRTAGPADWAAVGWQSLGNTLFGYAAWGWLLQRHPAATVSPWALLVPVFGIGTATLVTAEPLPGWKLGAAALVIGGLGVNLLGGWQRRR